MIPEEMKKADKGGMRPRALSTPYDPTEQEGAEESRKALEIKEL